MTRYLQKEPTKAATRKRTPYPGQMISRIICLLAVAAGVALAGCGTGDPRGLRTFATAFEKANQAEDLEGMLALYALEGTTANSQTLLKTAILFELGLPIKRIEFEPLTGAPEERIHYVHQGIQYGPTIRPSLRMHVYYDTEDAFTSRFTIGQLPDSSWRIVMSRPAGEPILKE